MRPSHPGQTVFLAPAESVSSARWHVLSALGLLALQLGFSWWLERRTSPIFFWIYVFMLILGALTYWRERFRRLIVDGQGIRYESGFHNLMPWFGSSPSWSVSVAQLRSRNLRFNPSRAIFSMRTVWLYLDIQTGQKRVIKPWQWTTADRAPLPNVQESFTLSHDVAAVENALRQLPVVQHLLEIQQYHLHATNGKVGDAFLSENWHRYMIVFAALLVILFLSSVFLPYAVWDEQLISAWLEWMQIVAVGAFAVYLFLYYRRGDMPVVVCLPGVGLLAILAWFAFEPSLTGLNLLTSRESTQYYTYTLTRIEKQAEFTPQEAGTPPFSLHYSLDYWWQLGIGSKHQFAMRKGGLGFWQIDMTAHHARMGH